MKELKELNAAFALEEQEGEGEFVARHLHPFYELYFLCEGSIDYFTENGIFPVKKDDLVIIPPRTIHKSVITKKSRRKRILLYIDKSYLPLCDEEDLWPTAQVFSLCDDLKTKGLIFSILEEYKGPSNPLMLKSLLYELFIRLSRMNTETYCEKTDDSSGYMPKIIQFINSEYKRDLTFKETADKFFLNPSYLSRLFKEKTGVNFSEYLNKYRIKKALELLMLGEKSISEIALEIGFNSSNHFCKTFKNIMGMTPMSYKKQFK